MGDGAVTCGSPGRAGSNACGDGSIASWLLAVAAISADIVTRADIVRNRIATIIPRAGVEIEQRADVGAGADQRRGGPQLVGRGGGASLRPGRRAASPAGALRGRRAGELRVDGEAVRLHLRRPGLAVILPGVDGGEDRLIKHPPAVRTGVSTPNRRCNPRSRIAAEGAGAILVGVILGAAGRGQDAQVVDRVLRH